jgi:hypothetical protein
MPDDFESVDARAHANEDEPKYSPWKLPSAETVPESDAGLEQIVRFARAADPTAHFRERWGEEYATNVQTLWQRCFQSFKAGVPPGRPPDELLMCLTYDVVLGPYLGVPDPHKLAFLRWLIDGVRGAL